MLSLRTPHKDDFFESRIEAKPKPPLTQLVQAVEDLHQEISECDQQISRWTWRKRKITSQCKDIVDKAKSTM